MRKAALIAAALALGACSPQTVGPSFHQTADAVTDSSPAPNVVSLAHSSGEKWDTRSTVPGGYARLYGADGVAVESIGPRSRLVSMPGPAGAPIHFAADDVVSLSIDEYTDAAGVAVRGLTLRMDSAEQTRAQNDALDRLASYWRSLSADQRAAAVAHIEATRDALEAAAPGILSVLRAALSPTP